MKTGCTRRASCLSVTGDGAPHTVLHSVLQCGGKNKVRRRRRRSPCLAFVIVMVMIMLLIVTSDNHQTFNKTISLQSPFFLPRKVAGEQTKDTSVKNQKQETRICVRIIFHSRSTLRNQFRFINTRLKERYSFLGKLDFHSNFSREKNTNYFKKI